MRCNFWIMYSLKTAYSICTDRTDRHDLSYPLTHAKVKYILSPINEMQFSDHVRIENSLFHLTLTLKMIVWHLLVLSKLIFI